MARSTRAISARTVLRSATFSARSVAPTRALRVWRPSAPLLAPLRQLCACASPPWLSRGAAMPRQVNELFAWIVLNCSPSVANPTTDLPLHHRGDGVFHSVLLHADRARRAIEADDDLGGAQLLVHARRTSLQARHHVAGIGERDHHARLHRAGELDRAVRVHALHAAAEVLAADAHHERKGRELGDVARGPLQAQRLRVRLDCIAPVDLAHQPPVRVRVRDDELALSGNVMSVVDRHARACRRPPGRTPRARRSARPWCRMRVEPSISPRGLNRKSPAEPPTIGHARKLGTERGDQSLLAARLGIHQQQAELMRARRATRCRSRRARSERTTSRASGSPKRLTFSINVSATVKRLAGR